MYKISLNDFYQVSKLTCVSTGGTYWAECFINEIINVDRCLFYKNKLYFWNKNTNSTWLIIDAYPNLKEICVDDYLLIVPYNKYITKDIEEQLWTILSNLDNSNTKLIESIVKML